MVFLTPLPPGVSGAVRVMERMGEQELQDLAATVAAKQPASATPSVRPEEAASVANALRFILRSAAKEHVDGAAFGKGVLTLGLSEEKAGALSTVWDAQGAVLAQVQATAQPAVGQLEGIDWKLGVTACSSDCDALSTGFVTVVARVRGADGSVSSTAFEMGIQQFEEFSAGFKRVGQLL